MQSSGTIENMLNTCILAHVTSEPWCPGPMQPPTCLPPWLQFPSITSRLWRRTGVTQACQAASQGRPWPRLEGGTLVCIMNGWPEPISTAKASHPLSPDPGTILLPEGRVQDACMSSCVSLQKSDAPGSTAPDLALSQGRAEDWLLGGSERGHMAEHGPQVPMRINTFLSSCPVSWGESSFPPSNLPESGLHLSHLASFKSSLKEWNSNCIISVILHE